MMETQTPRTCYFKHPYRAGPPCHDCPPLYPLCQPNPFISPEVHGDNEAQGDSTILYSGLCCKRTLQANVQYSHYVYRYDIFLILDTPVLADNEREVCIGSDPHFAIWLAGGSLLCYTFQGMHSAIYNLLSNKRLQMNALFIPDDAAYNNTWLGSIGISVLDNGDKVATLQFIADDGLVRIGERIQLDAAILISTGTALDYNHRLPSGLRIVSTGQFSILELDLILLLGFFKCQVVFQCQ